MPKRVCQSLASAAAAEATDPRKAPPTIVKMDLVAVHLVPELSLRVVYMGTHGNCPWLSFVSDLAFSLSMKCLADASDMGFENQPYVRTHQRRHQTATTDQNLSASNYGAGQPIQVSTVDVLPCNRVPIGDFPKLPN